MAGLAGHQVDERAVFNPSQGPDARGSLPLDGQKMVLELTSLFEATGEYGNMLTANTQASDSLNNLAKGSRDADMEQQGMSAIYGSDEEFSRIMRDLF